MTLRNTYLPPPSVSNTTSVTTQKIKPIKQHNNTIPHNADFNNIYNSYDNTTTSGSDYVSTSNEYNASSPIDNSNFNQNTYFEGSSGSDISSQNATNDQLLLASANTNLNVFNTSNANFSASVAKSPGMKYKKINDISKIMVN